MRKRKLGRTDLRVSELCLDATGFGWTLGADAAFATLDAFRNAGGNFIQFNARAEVDAADPAAASVAESIVGRWFRARAVPRGDFVLTSCLQLPPPRAGWSYLRIATAIREHCERILQRLQSPYLDLLLLRWTESLPVDETLVAVESLLRAGQFRHLGCCAFPAWRTMEWNGHAARRQLSRLAAAQIEVPFAHDLGSWRECLDLAREQSLGLVVRPPFQSCGTSGPPTATPALPIAVNDATSSELLRIARERGQPPHRVALAWALADPVVSAALVPADTPAALASFGTGDDLDLTFHEILRIARPERYGIVSGLFPHSGAPLVAEPAPSLSPANDYTLYTSNLPTP
jgi:aryl-alcohol dehydrogenase (NADP+)